MARFVAFFLFMGMVVPFGAEAQSQEGLGFSRFPDLHGATVVFAAEGDLWKVPVRGGGTGS